ncbi:hypothetical protein C8R44DRAFT_865485 [Mycena epipterygia]|nr:hypothetical protein C8R44DRAFT_865485 [Mycena epipterygia]
MGTTLDELKQFEEQPEERMAWMEEKQIWMNAIQARTVSIRVPFFAVPAIPINPLEVPTEYDQYAG